jgi:hypothetical protein
MELKRSSGSATNKVTEDFCESRIIVCPNELSEKHRIENRDQ